MAPMLEAQKPDGRVVRIRTKKWALEQIDRQHPGFHPLVEMVAIVQKKQYSKRDAVRFGYLKDIATFMVPRPAPLAALITEANQAGVGGEVRFTWDGGEPDDTGEVIEAAPHGLQK